MDRNEDPRFFGPPPYIFEMRDRLSKVVLWQTSVFDIPICGNFGNISDKVLQSGFVDCLRMYNGEYELIYVWEPEQIQLTYVTQGDEITLQNVHFRLMD